MIEHDPHEPISDCDCQQCAIAERDRLKQERDELAAMVGAKDLALESAQQAMNEMRHAYSSPEFFTGGHEGARRHFFNWAIKTDQEIGKALSITGPDALREIQARAIDEVRDYFKKSATSAKNYITALIVVALDELAASKRKGE